MIYYLTMFSFSAIFLYLAERSSKSLRKIYTFLGLSLPILLAVIRKDVVGIDVNVYMTPTLEAADNSSSLKGFLQLKSLNNTWGTVDFGYSLIIYFCSKYFFGLHGLFFINELLCLVPVYFGIKLFNRYMSKYRAERIIPIWLAILVYLFVFYNSSLNQTRQAISMSLMILTFGLMLNKKYLITIIIFPISLLIHSSSLVFLGVLFIYLICKFNIKFLQMLLILFSILFLFFYDEFFYLGISTLIKIGIIRDKYIGEIMAGSSEFNLSFLWLVVVFFLLFITIIMDKKYNIWIDRFFFLNAFVSLGMMLFASKYISFGRLQQYFLYFLVFIIPEFKLILSDKSKLDFYLHIAIILLFVFSYWFIGIGLVDPTGTKDYLFFWQ